MKILISGLPGKMQQELIPALLDSGFILFPFALTSEKHAGKRAEVAGRSFELLSAPVVAERITALGHDDTIFAADFSKPHSALSNVEFFCRLKLPFVMGTTGLDRTAAENLVRKSEISAVIAPNMAAPIVMLQAMVEFAAKNFPEALADFKLKVTESHQSAKVDKSGTGLAIAKDLELCGAQLKEEEFVAIRDPQKQRSMGIPESALGGHGYHTYELSSPDGTHEVGFFHNVRGRKVYLSGTIQALHFLEEQINNGIKGKAFSMRDVLGPVAE